MEAGALAIGMRKRVRKDEICKVAWCANQIWWGIQVVGRESKRNVQTHSFASAGVLCSLCGQTVECRFQLPRCIVSMPIGYTAPYGRSSHVVFEA